MEKKNQKFGIDSILDIALGAVVVINALVGRFVTNQGYPIALRGVFKVLFWGILAVASGLLLRRFFVNALGKAKRKMILSLIALFIVGVISVITFSINSSQMAAKIAIGLVTMIDGLNLSSLKGALMARGAREISRLIKAMGGNELSAYGLCHLGDYEATVFSQFSHNRKFGEAFIAGEKCEWLAEGYYTVCALMKLEEIYDVELPICRTVYDVLYKNVPPKIALDALFERRLKKEFY